MTLRFILFILSGFLFCQLNAQNTVFEVEKELNWASEPVSYSPMGIHKTEIWTFEDAARHPELPTLPQLEIHFPVPGEGRIKVQLTQVIYEPFEKEPTIEEEDFILEELVFNNRIHRNRKEYVGKITFLPIRKTASGNYERLVRFNLKAIYWNDGANRTPPPPPNTFSSVLSTGEIHKIAVNETGIQRLNYAFFKDELKLDMSQLNPKQIQLFGNGGGMLPEPVASFREDDLVENAMVFVGQNDTKFDEGDYFLFYGEGSSKWYFNAANELFFQPKNAFDTRNYYFIKINEANGQRISRQPSVDGSAYTTSSFNDFARLEQDRLNLLATEGNNTLGTGKTWYGDPFNPTRERTYNFNIPNRVTTAPIQLTAAMAARSSRSSNFKAIVDGQEFTSTNISSVQLTNSEAVFARSSTLSAALTSGNNDISVTMNYPGIGDQTNRAWLDYVQVNVRRNLIMTDDQMDFRDLNTRNFSNTTFAVASMSAAHTVWDITDPLRPKIQDGQMDGTTFQFGTNTGADSPLKTFIAFKNEQEFLTPEAIGPIANQNLHGIDGVDMVIIYHELFENAVQRLAAHRSHQDNLEIATVKIDQLYNEFSSGRQDPTAIRDFARMLYDRNSNFKYLLLFGDGSYDYRNISGKSVNFIPVYETNNSLDPINGFPADDYFGLVTEDDGATLDGEVDLAVGRIPAHDAFEADGVIDKIVFYDTNPKSLRDWRNRLVFVGDDGDGNLHMRQANQIADTVDQVYPVYNQNKILFDAFQQVATSGGVRIPQANASLNRDAFRGSLVINYMGHGGATGWAQERVLQDSDIEGWTNFENLPLIITATCSFAGYDDHKILPAGEQAMIKTDGGAIALFTTVRAVYSSQNFALTKSVFNEIFEVSPGYRPAMGEILRLSKNRSTANFSNTRKFTMLGDPAQRLAIPEYNVGTTSINGRVVGATTVDTLKALQKVTVTGYIYNHNGNVMTDFNGRVYPTIFDKESKLQTLGDEGADIMPFVLQKNVLFKGMATVTNGLFSFEFILPKDIDYLFGPGRISYYAEDGQRDARGYYEQIVIGGTDGNAIVDNLGPQVDVYMNTEDFVRSGTTDRNPTLLVKLSDDSGINIGGISIGHDLTAVLDNNTQKTFTMNDFYSAELDDFTQGTVRFPLYDVAEGLHHISVKAWDTSNNSGKGDTEFLVFNSEEASLKHVFNYPNPFTTSTNFQFEHNLNGQDLNVMVQIFSVSGKLVKTVEKDIFANGYRVTDVNWDGKDDYGDRLGRGVYLYKIKVKASNAKDQSIRSESNFEKLVILK